MHEGGGAFNSSYQKSENARRGVHLFFFTEKPFYANDKQNKLRNSEYILLIINYIFQRSVFAKKSPTRIASNWAVRTELAFR